MRYERKVVAELAEQYPGLLANRWIKFQDGADGSGRTRFCQPDAFWLDEERRELLIFEIKLHHTEQAWWQLFELYSPVLCRIFSGYTVKPCEVVRVYDCRTNANCPEDPVLVKDLNELRANSFNVHILYR